MTSFLTHKHILLGVTGSIAAYKSADLIRRLREAGAIVRVVMTENAKRFITPLTLQAVSGHPIHEDLFDVQAEAAMGHIELARWAEAVVVAPATADFMARLAQGNADDLLTTLCLATPAPIAIAPAMNQGMWKHTLTQNNLQALRNKNIHIFEPEEGSQACGDVGPGRLLEPVEIVKKIANLFSSALFAGKNIIVTAGPTHEAIDPVRYLTNASSGKMGYALAQAAREAGANVTLISGPVHLSVPAHVQCVSVMTAKEMYAEVMKRIDDCAILIAVAAVADYHCQTIATEKLSKQKEFMQLVLQRNPDIVAAVGQLTKRPFIIGFAAETEHVIANAKEKKQRKNMDMIIANQVGEGKGMNSDDNQVTVIDREQEIALPLMSKTKLAKKLIEIIGETFKRDEKKYG